MRNNEEIKLLEICFDMNSTFNKEGYQSKDNIELGLNVLIDINSIHLPNKNIETYLKKKLSDGKENSRIDYFFDSEKELYESFYVKIKEFLNETYSSPNWMRFVNERVIKNRKKNIILNDEEQEKYLKQQSIKIEKFIKETLNRLDAILNPDIIDENFFNKYKISIKPGETSIVNRVLSSSPLKDTTHIIELNNIVKTYQYYKINNELPINKTSNSLSKPKI